MSRPIIALWFLVCAFAGYGLGSLVKDAIAQGPFPWTGPVPVGFIQVEAAPNERIVNIAAIDYVQRVGNQAELHMRGGTILLLTPAQSVVLKQMFQQAMGAGYDPGD